MAVTEEMKTRDGIDGVLSGHLLEQWEEYATIYRDSFGELSVFQGFAKKLEEYLLPVLEGVVLDGGCGPGLNFERIIRATEPLRIIGLDISPKMLEGAGETKKKLAQKYQCQIDLKEADLCEGIPFPENTFNAQIFHLVFYYLPKGEWKNVLSEAFRVAKPGGYVISSNALKRFDFKKEIGILWLIKEVLLHPKAVYLSMTKVRPILVEFQELEEKGVLRYPTKKDLMSFHYELGFEKVVCKDIWRNMIMIRAHKPE